MPPQLDGTEDEANYALTFYACKSNIGSVRDKTYGSRLIVLGFIMNMDHIVVINFHEDPIWI